MRVFKGWIAAVLVFISAGALAQQATFSGGVLTLPAVQVGTAVYSNVTLGLTNPANYSFQLTGAGSSSPGTSPIVFNAGTGVLSIPSVKVGNDTYVNVTMALTNPAAYAFILTGATLQQPPTSGNAQACFDTAFLATGTKWVLFQQTSTNGAVVSTDKVENEILGPKTFNGQSTIEEKTQLTILTGTGAGTTSESRSYFQVANLKVLTYGNFTQILSQGFTIDATTVFNPPTEFNYALNAGESVTTTSTGTTTQQFTPNVIPPNVSNFSYTITYTFLGFEDVTVPAGAFAGACKWTYSTTTSGVTAVSTHWMSRKGAPLKTVSGNDVSELMPGSTVNGGPVGP